MTVNKLTTNLRGVIAILAIASFTTACNDETKTANNSTTEDTAAIRSTGDARSVPSTPEGTVTTNPDGTTPAAGTTTALKKKGKISTSMKAEDETVKMAMDKKGYYNRSEILPLYPGGATSLDNYINGNIEYPQEAIDNNTEGTVYVQFGVDEKGNISNVSTVGNKIGYGLEEEAVRVVSKMPKWTPGQVKGKTVKTWRTLPITYKIES